MSYILDALRRAEAERERERGAVPGVHARPLTLPDAPSPSRGRLPAWSGLAAGGALGAAAVAVLWLWGRTPPAAPPVAPPVVLSATVPAQPAAAMGPTPLAVVSAPESPPLLMQLPPSAPAPTAASAAAARPAAPAAPVLAPAPAVPRPVPAAAAAARPQPWAELTAEQKREWPTMTIGGSIYSDHAGSRFVIVNGQVVREGEAAAPGVTLERIGPKSAVLRLKDRRVELPF